MRIPRSRLWLCAAVAGLIHVVLFVAIVVRQAIEEPELQLEGRFVKRRPLRQRVLERHVRQPQHAPTLQRAVSVPRATMHRSAVPPPAPHPPAVLASQRMLPSVLLRAIGQGIGVPGAQELRSGRVGVAVTADSDLDLDLELLEVGSMDTGQHRALVVVDPNDRRGLEGYVHLSAVGIDAALRLAEERFGWGAAPAKDTRIPDCRHEADVRALAGLAAELQAHTGLRALVDEDASLDDPRWLDSPLVLLTSLVEFTPTRAEVENLGQYLTSGGLAYVEVVGYHDYATSARGEIRDLSSLRELIRQALASQGLQERVDWRFEPLPMTHPLFSCYYDIDALPANYWRTVNRPKETQVAGYVAKPALDGIPEYVEGVHLDGRLVAIYSQQNYRDFWRRRPEHALTDASDSDSKAYSLRHHPTSDPAIRVGINVVVYALTQEGSLARRYVRRDP